jgi:hypothetical protein
MNKPQIDPTTLVDEGRWDASLQQAWNNLPADVREEIESNVGDYIAALTRELEDFFSLPHEGARARTSSGR